MTGARMVVQGRNSCKLVTVLFNPTDALLQLTMLMKLKGTYYAFKKTS